MRNRTQTVCTMGLGLLAADFMLSRKTTIPPVRPEE